MSVSCCAAMFRVGGGPWQTRVAALLDVLDTGARDCEATLERKTDDGAVEATQLSRVARRSIPACRAADDTEDEHWATSGPNKPCGGNRTEVVGATKLADVPWSDLGIRVTPSEDLLESGSEDHPSVVRVMPVGVDVSMWSYVHVDRRAPLFTAFEVNVSAWEPDDADPLPRLACLDTGRSVLAHDDYNSKPSELRGFSWGTEGSSGVVARGQFVPPSWLEADAQRAANTMANAAPQFVGARQVWRDEVEAKIRETLQSECVLPVFAVAVAFQPYP